MFRERALIFDFPFVRILVILAVNVDARKGLQITEQLVLRLTENTAIYEDLREQYLSKTIWDQANILILLG